MVSEGLPRRVDQHVLETESRWFTQRQIPPRWITRNVSEDYGLDLNVEIVNSFDEVTGQNFSIQVKSQAAPLLSRPAARVVLKASALRYLKTRPEPTMLVLFSKADKDAVWAWSSTLRDPKPGASTATIDLSGSPSLIDTDWHQVQSEVNDYFRARPEVDPAAVNRLERFGRIQIDITGSRNLLREEVDEFEDLISAGHLLERTVHQFLSARPEMLLGGEYTSLVPEFPLSGAGGAGGFQPDFLVESVTGQAHILELKGLGPNRNMLVEQLHRQLSSHQAAAADDANVARVRDALGLRLVDTLIAVAGRDADFQDPVEAKVELGRALGSRFFTLDDVVRMARARQL